MFRRFWSASRLTPTAQTSQSTLRTLISWRKNWRTKFKIINNVRNIFSKPSKSYQFRPYFQTFIKTNFFRIRYVMKATSRAYLAKQAGTNSFQKIQNSKILKDYFNIFVMNGIFLTHFVINNFIRFQINILLIDRWRWWARRGIWGRRERCCHRRRRGNKITFWFFSFLFFESLPNFDDYFEQIRDLCSRTVTKSFFSHKFVKIFHGQKQIKVFTAQQLKQQSDQILASKKKRGKKK